MGSSAGLKEPRGLAGRALPPAFALSSSLTWSASWFLPPCRRFSFYPLIRGVLGMCAQHSSLQSLFSSFLHPPVNGVPWPQEATRRNSHTFSCRMLIRPPDEPGAENQEARQRYEVMQCFTVSQPKSFKEEGEGRGEHPLLLTLRSGRAGRKRSRVGMAMQAGGGLGWGWLCRQEDQGRDGNAGRGRNRWGWQCRQEEDRVGTAMQAGGPG